MITHILILLLINFIIVELVDRQNIPNTIANFIASKITNNSITNVWVNKPFNCSYCLTFWISLIYLLTINPFTLLWLIVAISIALLNAIYTKLIYYVLGFIDLAIDLVFNKLHNLLTK